MHMQPVPRTEELPSRIAEVVRWSRTVLVVCNGHAKEADTFLTYSAYVQIDAKWVMGETMIRKTMGIEEMQEPAKTGCERYEDWTAAAYRHGKHGRGFQRQVLWRADISPFHIQFCDVQR